MNLETVFGELATRLASITGLQTYAYPPSSITPPAAVMWPEQVDFDETYGRGSDRITVALWVVSGQTGDESAWASLAAWGSGSGATSIKAVVEAGTYSAFDVVHVVDATFGEFTVADTTYISTRFTLVIDGDGE